MKYTPRTRITPRLLERAITLELHNLAEQGYDPVRAHRIQLYAREHQRLTEQ